jgi:plasmid stabilization system protein ParE
MKIFWSPLAIDRSSEIVDYIAQDKPSAAEKWISTVFSKVEQLKSSPEIGRIVPELNNAQFRAYNSLVNFQMLRIRNYE